MLKKLYFGIVMLTFTLYGNSQEQTNVTLKLNNASLKNIIELLEQQSKYTFIYNETIDLEQKKSVDISNQKFENILHSILENTNIEWKIKRNHVTLTLKKPESSTQKMTISGYVTDFESSELLIGANVYDVNSGKGTASNEYGFFSLTVPAGETSLRFSYIGYVSETKKINLKKDEKLNIKLKQSIQLEEVLVIGKKNEESGVNATQMSSINVPLNIIKTAPVLFGENDVMKTIQMLPGVQAGTQGSAGIYVRGGGPDENLILLDGIPLYNIDHLLGFFSVFTPEALKKVTFFKGSFPARFGGRLSSVIDVRTNDGDMYNYHGTIGIGLLSSKLQLEGPIIKGRTSFHISGRRSYLDLIVEPFLSEKEDVDVYFYDFNGKINHKFNDKSRIFLNFYNGLDKFGGNLDEGYDENIDKYGAAIAWGNTLLSSRWNYIFSPKLFSNTTVAFTKYNFDVNYQNYSFNKQENIESQRDSRYNSGINDIALKIDFEYYPSPKHHVKFGTGYLYHKFKPEVETLRVKENEDSIASDSTYRHLSNSIIFADELSVYAEDDINLTPRLNLNAGLHFSLFKVRNTTYTSLQPRLSSRFQLTDDIALKTSYTKMNQYIHLLSSYNLSLPSDLWVPTTDNIKPMRSHQYSLGTYYTAIPGWEFSTETYFKNMRNIIEYKDGTTFFGSSSNWEEKVESGRGRSYGIELMAQKTTGKTTGWISYTLAKSERKFDKAGINMGKWFPYKYDRRHHINITANHKLSKNIDLSASWEFYTGGVFTVSEEVMSVISPHYRVPFTEYYYVSNIIPDNDPNPTTTTANYINERNNYRVPASHCLNLGINIRKQKKLGERIWNFGIYNAYNAMTPHFVHKTTIDEYDENGNYINSRNVLRKLTIFPFIPSFTYTFKF